MPTRPHRREDLQPRCHCAALALKRLVLAIRATLAFGAAVVMPQDSAAASITCTVTAQNPATVSGNDTYTDTYNVENGGVLSITNTGNLNIASPLNTNTGGTVANSGTIQTGAQTDWKNYSSFANAAGATRQPESRGIRQLFLGRRHQCRQPCQQRQRQLLERRQPEQCRRGQRHQLWQLRKRRGWQPSATPAVSTTRAPARCSTMPASSSTAPEPRSPTAPPWSTNRPSSWCSGLALIIIPPTLFSPGVAASLQNIVLRAQTHMGQPALGGFVIKAFWIIKSVMGFRQFLTRGLDNVQGEWTLVCLAWNLKRMAVLRLQ